MNVLTVARFTIQEAISRRLVLAGLIVSLLLVSLFAVGFDILYRQTLQGTPGFPSGQSAALIFASIMLVLSLYAVHFLSGFLALFVSVGAISGEVDSGALHAVLARPLHRAEYVGGRWLGFMVLICVYVGMVAGLLLLIARVISGYEPPDPARTVLLMVLSAATLLSLSLFGSALLSTLANGVVVFTLFGLAWLGGIIEYLGHALRNQDMMTLGIAVSLLVPSDAIWRGASYYIQSPAFLTGINTAGAGNPFTATQPPSTPFVLWAIAYPMFLLVGAILAFRQRDL